MTNRDDDDLLAELGLEITPIKASAHTPKEERILAGFEDILRFVETHGRAPEHGEEKEIFERLYAVRLDRLRAMTTLHSLLAPLDTNELLTEAPHVLAPEQADALDDDSLMAELGMGGVSSDDITQLRHVRSFEERKTAEDIAQRARCEDFDRFQPLFEQAERELKAGARKTIRFGRDASVDVGNFFILSGQTVYIAKMGETFRTPNGTPDARMRVIFSNGTESDLLQRSLQRALYKDDTGRRITDADTDAGPLFGDASEPEDIASGTIYVLRSLSDDPFIEEHRKTIHKIGITGGKVETRIADAVNDPTYLLAKVEVVATYKLSNINRVKLENIFHRLFAPAQLDILIKDRFGKPVRPREWFVVPLPVIDEAVNRILNGTITEVVYDPQTVSLKLV
jgi:hypothetical protein